MLELCNFCQIPFPFTILVYNSCLICTLLLFIIMCMIERRGSPVLDALDKAYGQNFTAYPNVKTFNTVMYC